MKNIINITYTITITMIITFSFISSIFSQQVQNTSIIQKGKKKQVVSIFNLKSLKQYSNLLISSDPDMPTTKYAYSSNLAKISIGGNIGIFDFSNKFFQFFIGFSGMIEIHNYSKPYFFAYETWRGTLSGDILLSVPLQKNNKKNEKHSIQFITKFYHESQHISDTQNFTNFASIFEGRQQTEGINELNKQNSDFFSFEMLKIKLQYYFQHGFYNLIVSMSTMVIFQILERATVRNESVHKYGFAFEIKQGFAILSNTLLIWIGYFHEWRWGNYQSTNKILQVYYLPKNSTLPDNLNQIDFQIIEIALEYRARHEIHYMFYITYENSFGRGVDLLQKRKGFGFGIRLSI